MSFISELDKLCSVFLNHLPETFTFGRTKEKTFLLKRKLKTIACDSLFESASGSKWKTLASLDGGMECIRHLRSQLLMKCFDMRMNFQKYEAERLEFLIEKLEHFTESGEALLTFLLSLAATGNDRLYPDHRSIECKGSSEVDSGTAEEFPLYSSALFSGMSLEHAEQFGPNFETSLQNEIERNLNVFTASPGSSLLGVRLFRQNNVDSYDRLTQFSLFGALLQTRTSDMDIKLNLPSIPDNADCMGLMIKVPSSNDQSDDEGFQSAPNMTPDSIIEPFIVAGTSIWEAALHHKPSNYRTWESIGRMPVPNENPFVTEAGHDVFDHLCCLREKEAMQLEGAMQSKWEFVQQSRLVEDSLNVLMGISSRTFPISQDMEIFTVQKGIRMSGLSSESVFELLSMLAANGSSYWRLLAFLALASSHSRCERGLVFQAFVSGIRKYLLYYKACVLSVSPMTTSLLALAFLFRTLGSQLRYLADLCKVGLDNTKEDLKTLPLGVGLLSYLYHEALGRCEGENYHVLLSLLRSSCEPFTRYVHEWVYEGICKDVYGEFMIEVNDDYLNCKDKRYWTHGYVLQSHKEELPFFLDSLMHDMYSCGKSINLLKRCNPRHYICWTEIPLPPITMNFSSEDLMAIEKECELYSRRMQSVARSSCESREEKRRREARLRENMELLAWTVEAKQQDEKAKARQELVNLQHGLLPEVEHEEPSTLCNVRRPRLENENEQQTLEKQQMKQGSVPNQDLCVPESQELGLLEDLQHFDTKIDVSSLTKLDANEKDTFVTRPASSSMDLLDSTEVQLIPRRKLTAKHVSDSVIQDVLYPRQTENVCDADVPKTHYQAEYCTIKPEDSPVEPALDFDVTEVDLRLKVCSANDEQRKVPANEETKPCKEVLVEDERSMLVGEEQSPSPTVQQRPAEPFYDLEQYQDSFGAMSEAPRPLFLLGAKASWEISDEGAIQASEMVSLPILMQRSLVPPIRTQVNIVNKAVLDFYFVDLKIEKHFETLQHFLLLEDGEFAQSLSDQLFDKMGEGLGPREMLNPLVLNAVLARALQYSLHGDGTIADHLSFALKGFPETFKPNDPLALSCVELKYKVPWPANIVITESCIGKYNRLFSFMLQLKRMVWTLKDVWFHLQHSDLVDRAATSAEFRGLHLFRQEMQHFVRVIQEYIVTQILHVTWSEFHQRLGSITNLDDLCRIHSEYLNNAIFRALLTAKAAPVMNVILGIFKVILKFRNELVSHQWDLGQQGSISHPNFRALQESFEAFKNYSNFLYKVVVKLVQRGYQPHLEDFLLRLNFNSYYCADKVLTT
uniref:Gamma-tubulin complex component 6 n=1 Tax=Eptatretus burgeri TaxID=7764 RepID=A0A8C4QNZ8_EPTBU